MSGKVGGEPVPRRVGPGTGTFEKMVQTLEKAGATVRRSAQEIERATQ
jgi:hypothetical protein